MAKKFTVTELEDIENKFRSMIEGQEWSYLVIDNSIALRKALVNALSKAGCENILEAKDGVEGMITVRNCPSRVVAVVELNTPVMDGIDFLQRFRQEKQFAECPVILMSAETRKERIVQAIKSGANAYLKKPFPPEVLVEKLRAMNLL